MSNRIKAIYSFRFDSINIRKSRNFLNTNLKDEMMSGWGDNTKGNYNNGELQNNSDVNLLNLSIDQEKLLLN